MKKLLLIAVMAVMAMNVMAQRSMDKLDRGLVAIKTDAGIFCSWRIFGEEYYDVTYNIYRDGTKLNAEPLSVSNFVDAAGNAGSKYTVSAVVRGKEGAQCNAAGVWEQNYLEITPDHSGLKSTYVPNDACMADVDGDGELEILMKFDNASWAGESYKKAGHNGEYFIIEVFKLNGKRLWWIDLGPNMADFQNNEQNIVAYDWDQDGKAEAVMRASDGTVIHMADGTEYVIGDRSKNYLAATNSDQWFVHQGNEYLVYMNGETGKPYQVMDYPLKRLENGETDLKKAWGDGYGHRSTKHFFGAPYLDGRHPSIFLARGIYTRHKMIALDVDPATHELTERWRWNCNDSSSPWYGNGYHNYAVADVDWDGRDEICFGSMVIDDNGKGLSTTGLGHGDAQHHGDFNPYIHGHEIFACLEDNPGNNYRDATTSKIYYRYNSSDDDGRCIAGNFSNDYPGAMAFSGRDIPISCVTADHISGMEKGSIPDNFRIYWDGDLCDEGFNYVNGKNSAGGIYKHGIGLIETLKGSMTNNDTKGTPCYQGDILGDWREEVIMRTKDNKIRIYSTTIPTEWRNYTLWHDMQYRQAMVWQMCGYNQPPHVSYFLGELEGITQAPPALTMKDRIEITNSGSITSSHENQQLIMAETNDMTVSVAEGAKPYLFFDNAPSHIIGNDNNSNIESVYYKHTLTGGAFDGDMRLVKQGDGILELPNVTEKYTGNTEVWAGTLIFNGTMENSHVWLNRHTSLESNGGQFKKGIEAFYNATIYPGGKDNAGSLTTTTLELGFGSRIVFDINADGTSDQIITDELSIEKKDWQYGPEYSSPIFQINGTQLEPGDYTLVKANKFEGNVEDIVIKGLTGKKYELTYNNGQVILTIFPLRKPTEIVWDGGNDGIWDLVETENYLVNGEKDYFVTGDNVIFNDNAAQTTINITGELLPGSITFDNNSKNFIVQGDGVIIGSTSLTKKGTGNLTINNTNQFTGGVNIENGKIVVTSLANKEGSEYGALGGVDNLITFNGGTLSVKNNIVTTQPVITSEGDGTVEVASGCQLSLNGTITGRNNELTKTGAGTLLLNGAASYGTMNLNQGTIQGSENSSNVHLYPSTIVLNGGTLRDPDNIYSYSTNNANIVVPEGKTATWTLDSRCNYKGKLTGKGTLNINVTSTRSYMQGDWSQFYGTLKFLKHKTGSYEPQLIWDNSKGLGNATVTGEFDNNGKDTSIGTLSDNATLTGTGRYTVKHLTPVITRSRGGSKNTYFEVSSTLILNGDVNVTLKGTNNLTAGESFVLWSCKSFQATSNVTVSLPELSTGLYWDTTELLTTRGTLKITDVPPTGIVDVKNNIKEGIEVWYTTDGRRLDGKPTRKGIYIINGKKVVIK